MISRLIFGCFGNSTAKFTWIGGEDDSSLVLGGGRPFFAKIKNPSRRVLDISGDTGHDSVRVVDVRTVPKSPTTPLRFSSVVRLCVSVRESQSTDSCDLKKLKSLTREPVIFYDRSGKRYERTIFSLKYRRTSPGAFTMTVHVQGGLPIKRFVTGDEFTLGVSQILGVSCTCTRFDILDVTIP